MTTTNQDNAVAHVTDLKIDCTLAVAHHNFIPIKLTLRLRSSLLRVGVGGRLEPTEIHNITSVSLTDLLLVDQDSPVRGIMLPSCNIARNNPRQQS